MNFALSPSGTAGYPDSSFEVSHHHQEPVHSRWWKERSAQERPGRGMTTMSTETIRQAADLPSGGLLTTRKGEDQEEEEEEEEEKEAVC